MNAKKMIKRRAGSFDLVLNSKNPKELLLLAVLAGDSPNILRQLGYEVSWNQLNDLRIELSNLLYELEKRIIDSKEGVEIKTHTFK